ncbi:MAG TPA: PP2C family protein-serine/threonine phosphatase [Calditrichia bacterium]|nr:serine/threonine-protein phosphatase [Calditrichota bacterium]HQU74790.1 PP2C family protein-serine/threonine phosphatase [Calditrichia bacterium]HQV31648.1 PP2C family protein-serine/threonine phosphatase [Calditrichia bacterium]
MADNKPPGFWATLKKDWQSTPIRASLRRNFQELKAFYLTREQQDRLENMNWLKRWLFTGTWLLKILFFKLSPFRRLLLVASLYMLLAQNGNGGRDLTIFGAITILLLLLLELKDKLLAHSELADGRKVQLALAPEANPRVPGWEIWLFTRSANDVGGDLVDILQLTDKCHGLALGDVAGKGLKAALFMAKLQATLRALASDFDDLGLFAKKVNRIFNRDGLPNSFASLIYLCVESNSPSVRLVNAGHMPPLLLHNGTVRELDKGGRALGLVADSDYREERLSLEPGATLFLYSDGLTEAQNEEGAFFGDERMIALLKRCGELSPSETGRQFINAVDGFVGEARPADDLSLIILRRNA